MWRRKIEEQERTDRLVAARMEQIRARRAEKEAREEAREKRFREALERNGEALFMDLCDYELEEDDSQPPVDDVPQTYP